MAVRQRIHKFPAILCSTIGVTCMLLLSACSNASEVQEGPSPSTSSPTSPPTESRPSDAPQEPEPPLAESVLGTWTSADPGEPHLEFTADGIVSGSDGCNGVGGTYTVDEAAGLVSIERFPSTLIACPDIDDWLRGMQVVKVDEEDFLQVYDAEMKHLGQMYRAE